MLQLDVTVAVKLLITLVVLLANGGAVELAMLYVDVIVAVAVVLELETDNVVAFGKVVFEVIVVVELARPVGKEVVFVGRLVGDEVLAVAVALFAKVLLMAAGKALRNRASCMILLAL